MKRVLLILSLACSIVLGASLAQAAPVEIWNVSMTAKFTDIVMSDGSRIADGGDYFSWDNGNSFLSLSAGDGQLTPSWSGYGSYFTGGLDREIKEGSPAAVELKSLKLSYDITLAPEGSSDSISLTLDLPLYYYHYVNDIGENYGSIFFLLGSDWASKQVVYQDIAYEFSLGWLDMYDYRIWSYGMDPGQADDIRNYFGWGADDVFYGYVYAPNFNPIYFGGEVKGPAVPVPAAVWLMGTGLAGLVALKRRQRK